MKLQVRPVSTIKTSNVTAYHENKKMTADCPTRTHPKNSFPIAALPRLKLLLYFTKKQRHWKILMTTMWSK